MNGQILGRTEYAYTMFQQPEADRVDVAATAAGRAAEVAAGLRQDARPAPAAGRHGDAEVDAAIATRALAARRRRHRRTRAGATSPTARRGARADGFAHIDPLRRHRSRRRSRCRSDARPRSRSRNPDGARRRRRAASRRHVGARGALVARRARRAARAVGRRGRELASRRCARSAPRSPGVRLLVDTGHVADWGGDPCELLELADHVQLRQGKPGHTQVHVDDPTRRRRLRARCSPGSSSSTTAASSASSTSICPTTAGRSPTPSLGRATSPPTSAAL